MPATRTQHHQIVDVFASCILSGCVYLCLCVYMHLIGRAYQNYTRSSREAFLARVYKHSLQAYMRCIPIPPEMPRLRRPHSKACRRESFRLRKNWCSVCMCAYIYQKHVNLQAHVQDTNVQSRDLAGGAFPHKTPTHPPTWPCMSSDTKSARPFTLTSTT